MQRAEQIAVDWTVLNRMRRNGTDLVGDVRGYRDEKDPDDLSLEMARGILGGNIVDNTGGATHFYSPQIMPREGGSTAGYDVGGGLERTEGLSSRNYRPSFAATFRRSLSLVCAQQISVSSGRRGMAQLDKRLSPVLERP